MTLYKALVELETTLELEMVIDPVRPMVNVHVTKSITLSLEDLIDPRASNNFISQVWQSLL